MKSKYFTFLLITVLAAGTTAFAQTLIILKDATSIEVDSVRYEDKQCIYTKNGSERSVPLTLIEGIYVLNQGRIYPPPQSEQAEVAPPVKTPTELSRQEETIAGDLKDKTLGEEQVGKVLSDWKDYRYESYGFEFKLPKEWQQIESDVPSRDDVEVLTFELKGAEYYSSAHNLRFFIFILENPKRLPYERLFKMENRPDLVQSYYADEANIVVDGIPAKLVYDNPDYKDGPIIYIPLEKKFITIMAPKEGDAFFNDFIATFKLFEPLAVSNTSKPVQKKQYDNLYDWCDDAPIPADCFAKLARREASPEPLLCEKITLENSRSEGFYYYYKNYCYTRVAYKRKDISLCENMIGEGIFEKKKLLAEKECRGWVNYKLALDNNDISYCQKIDKDIWVNDGFGMDTVSQLQCYVAVAVKVRNPQLCDKIIPSRTRTGGRISKKWCYYYYAIKKKDCSFVPKHFPALISQCEREIRN